MAIKFSNKNDNSINSFIGDTTIFRGEFEANGPLRIDGKFYGKIISGDMVYIGRKSLSECVILAKDVIIGGTVKGSIYSENTLTVLKTAEIIGNIYAGSVSMEDGVTFDGECKILGKDEIKKLIETKKNERI